MMKVQKSLDYDRFESPTTQRLVNGNKVLAIAENMEKNGNYPAFHIIVREHGQKWRIVFGQHRFDAAVLAKQPIYFVVDNEMTDQQVLELEEFRQNWSITDFVIAQANRGNENYEVLKEFREQYKMPMGVAANLLDSAGARSARDGSFVPTREKEARAVMELAEAMQFDGSKDSRFLYALSLIVNLPDFDKKRLLSGKTALTMLRKQRTVDDYVQMIEEIYNYRRLTPVSLAWQVRELQAKRKNEALINCRKSAGNNTKAK